MRTTVNIFREELPGTVEPQGPAGADGSPSDPLWPGTVADSAFFDLQSLRDIADDTHGPGLALQFLIDFFSLQEDRLSRLLAALAAEEPRDSADAVLSLQTASSMAGATGIAERCAIILPLIVSRNFASARVQAAALQHDVDALAAAAPVLLQQAKAQLCPPSHS